MARIIAGMFTTQDEAAATRDAVVRQGFAEDDVCTFFNNAPGQHAEFPTGGDEAIDPQATEAHGGAARGAAIGAAAMGLAGLTAGPLGAAAMAGVGGYVGGLAGMGSGTQDEHGTPARRPAGVMVAVRVGDQEGAQRAIEALRAHGAENIEEAEGQWENGDWVDFDPVSYPHLVDQPSLHGPGAPR
jgi:hypothetical protein